MTVRFSPHAIKRLLERFRQFPDRIARIIESGLPRPGTSRAKQSRWLVHGVIEGRWVRLVLTEDRPGFFTVITGMWL